MKVDGACHCGAIAYEAEVDPARCGVCHCTDCQVLTGTAFRTNVQASAESFVLTKGTPKIYIKLADSGARRAHAFCGDCGTPIYATDAEGPPKSFGLRIGSIRQRTQLRPVVQLWRRSALPWVDDVGALRSFDRQF